MPARLVYAPKAYVFVKNSTGTVLNLTDYVVSGQVQRLVNQPSTASVVLRNPNRKFTIPKSPTFHPMDPITIFLERLKGFPVQTFTGYLDDTPYYQMYPGPITLNATCTLKRLMYTFWDPSLPYVNAFLNKFGWINDNGQLRNVPALADQANVAQGNAGTLQDGSIGKLLWAALTDIADWHDSNIWIEQLPSGSNGIAARMAKLMATLATDEATAADQFTQFMQSIIGTSSQGSGGGAGGAAAGGLTSGGNLTVLGQPITQAQLDIANVALAEGVSLNAPKDAMIACMYATMGESGMGSSPNTYSGTGGAQGPWQTEAGDYNSGHDIQGAANGFYTGGKDFQAGGAIACANRGDPPWMIANEVEANAVWNNSRGDSYQNRWPGGQSQGIAEATAIVNAYLQGGNIKSGASAVSGAVDAGVGAVSGAVAVGVIGVNQQGQAHGAGDVVLQAGSASGTQGSLGSSSTSVIDAMISAAATINNAKYPYSWGGGHEQAGTPSTHSPHSDGSGAPVLGYDCSGAVAAVLAAAGLWKKGASVPADDGVVAALKDKGYIVDGPGAGTPECTIYDNPGVHIYMRLNGKFWGTWAGGAVTSAGGGAGWQSDGFAMSGYNQYHVPTSVLTQQTTYQGPIGTGASGTSAGGASGSSATPTTQDIMSDAKAQAFTAELNFPSVQDMTTAMILGGAGKGLMHDQQILPFIQQLSQASMRSFQSLPNGDFYAFYPDYFGETNHRAPYWNIDDIEVLNGGINLSDAPLVTHQFAVGDNTYPVDNQLINMLFSAGTITVFNAFLSSDALGINTDTKGMTSVMSQAEAIEFVKRYGARPNVANYPMVRSALYEMFLAYQGFMMAWSNQFQTPFSMTFMPELFPGGKVAFPNHGLQMYINSVTHSWDYGEAGFTTNAVLSAPAAMAGVSNPDLPPNMVQALVEPVRQAAALNQTTGKPKSRNAQTTASTVAGSAKGAANTIAKSVDEVVQGILGAF